MKPHAAVVDLEEYRLGPSEIERTRDLMALVPRGRSTALDIGARDGHFSLQLASIFEEVTALDLSRPAWTASRVTTVAGNITDLKFPTRSFDVIFCAEVLEHVPDVEKACAELSRVAKHEIVVGVPFRQDIRVGRLTCNRCGRISPPWGHVHTFDEHRLAALFPGWAITSRSFVGQTRDITTSLACLLMDFGGNPWAAYTQEEPCIHCGARFSQPPPASPMKRIFAGLAGRMNRLQQRLAKPQPQWIHILLQRVPEDSEIPRPPSREPG